MWLLPVAKVLIPFREWHGHRIRFCLSDYISIIIIIIMINNIHLIHEYELYFHSTGQFVSHTNLVMACRWEGKWLNDSLKYILNIFFANAFDIDCLLSPIILLWWHPDYEIPIVLKMKVLKKMCIWYLSGQQYLDHHILNVCPLLKSKILSSSFSWLSKSFKNVLKQKENDKIERILKGFFPNEQHGFKNCLYFVKREK